MKICGGFAKKNQIEMGKHFHAKIGRQNPEA
jgi:hypothetical protein